jgi:hypothetical protein
MVNSSELLQAIYNDRSMYRRDGSKKSKKGYLGPIENKVTGGTMTEFSVGIEIDGEEVEVPAMVPTLSSAEIQYIQEMKPGKGWDMSNPVERSIVKKAKDHAQKRLSENKSVYYQDLENNSTFDELFETAYANYKQRQKERVAGTARSIAQGATLGFADELEAIMRSHSKPEGDYKKELKIIREEQEKFESLQPKAAIAAEIAGAIPTGVGVAGGLSRLGMTSIAKQAGTEGAVYGFGSGESFGERVSGATIGGLGGFAIGKVLSLATMPSSSGGLRTELNDLADDALDPEGVAASQAIEKSKANETFLEVDQPKYTTKPIAESKTFGELWENTTGALANFYNDKVTGVSDELMRVVSPQIGARFQRADETALRNVNKSLGNLSEALVPVIKIINDSSRAKGALLDYGAGKLGKTRNQSLARLEKELSEDLNTQHMNTLKAYLQVSFDRNSKLNKKVFGAEFSDEITYLHTRNNSFITKLKEDGLSDTEIEKMFGDKAYEPRSRGSYLDKKGNVPDPSEYDNPIITDMQRVFKMERLAQLQEKFGVDISSIARKPGQKAITPEEFMDALFYSFRSKGISNDGSQYAVNKITDSIMGQQKTPHPLIQAANSASYATTLAGPLSAILNLADIPLVGAKYGGRAVLEGLNVLRPFKKIPDPDLAKMGLNNQTFGEFINKTNDLAGSNQGFMSRSAELMRNGTDFLMKGSGFAALDMVGKKGVMRGVLRSASDDAQAGKLGDNWSFYFNDAELGVLERQLKQHGTDWTKYTGKGSELVEELMFAGLGQQQLISAAGRPAAWARNPNLRPLWALRGFVVKQQALALREVMGNIKAGKPEKAAKFLGRYAMYGAGGYAITNEVRQGIFGDGEMSFGGLVRGYGDAWASLLTANTLGLNDYQYGQIKQNGLLYTLAEGSLPIIVDRPLDIGRTIIETLDGERPPQAIATEFPIISQYAKVTERGARAVDATGIEGMMSELLRKSNPEEN